VRSEKRGVDGVEVPRASAREDEEAAIPGGVGYDEDG
jgi:hypothetical protein